MANAEDKSGLKMLMQAKKLYEEAKNEIMIGNDGKIIKNSLKNELSLAVREGDKVIVVRIFVGNEKEYEVYRNTHS